MARVERKHAEHRKEPTRPHEHEEVPHLSHAELLAWRGLLETEARLIPLLDLELRERCNMSVNEFDVLYQLRRAPQMRRRMKDLAAAVLVTPGGITRLVARLEERGWVTRAGQSGVQAVEAVLTASGRKALDDAMDAHFAGVKRAFVSRLSGSEIATLMKIWERLRDAEPAAPEKARR